jgi:Amt family ammonium transporter
VATFIILKLLDKIIGLRVSHEEEEQGLDLSLHSETGYKF